MNRFSTSAAPDSAPSRIAEESTLGRACAHVAEACWLAATAVIPLLYDPNAVNGFESAKSASLRMFGIILLGATILRAVGALSTPRSDQRSISSFAPPAWLLGGLAIVGSAMLATVFSVQPAQSFWGSPQWLQGAFTQLCQVGFFIGVAANLRTGDQIARLVNTALAASIPVAIYALLQRADLDPIDFVGIRGDAISFAGHPIYMAGYLLMLMPLCVWRLWSSLPGRAECRPSGATLFFMFILLLQFAAFLSAGKRGPIVALLLATAFGILLLAACLRRFRWIAWGLGLVATSAICLTVLAVLGRERLLPDISLLDRLAAVVPLDAHTGDSFRANIWANGPAVVLTAKPFLFPDGTLDPWHGLRPLLGYGPETLQGILPHFWLWVPGGPTLLTESRFHNMFWETWQSIGLLGVIAWWSFCAVIFWSGARALHLGEGRGGWLRFAVPAAAAGLLAGLTMAMLYGWGYFGMGFQCGFAGGLVLAIVAEAFLRRLQPDPAFPDPAARWLIVALLVALLGHQIDMGFAFPTGNTTLLFWLFSGVIVGREIGLRGGDSVLASVESASDEGGSAPQGRPWVPAGLVTGILTGGILATMLHAFVSLLADNSFTTGTVLDISLTRLRSNGAASHLLPLLFLPTWLAANLCILRAFPAASARPATGKAFTLAAGLSALLATGFAFLQAQWTASVGPIPIANAPLSTALSQAIYLGILGVTFCGILLTATLVLAWVLATNPRRACPPPRRREFLAALALIPLASLLLGPAVIDVIRNEALGKWALILDAHDRKPLAAGLYEAALRIHPNDVPNRIVCGADLMADAEAEKDPSRFSAKMQKAAAMLLSTRTISELNYANYHLGRLYLRWGARLRDPQARQAAGLQARDALARATAFAPEAETAWFEASIADRLLLGDIQESNRKLHRADALTAKLDPTSWGDFYARLAFAKEDPSLSEFYATRATHYLRDSLTWQPDPPRPKNPSRQEQADLQFNTFRSLVTLARLERLQNNNPAALTDLLEAARIGAKEDVWEAEALLTRLYVEAGKPVIALAHLDLAQANAPENAKTELAALHAQITKKVSP